MITLYGIPVSSYVAKVRLALRLKGLAFTEVAPPGGYGSSTYRAIVPAGSVPAIVHDGFALHESEAILEYLEEAFPEPALHPRDAKTRAWHRAIALYHDTKLEPAVRAMFPFIARAPDAGERESLRSAYADRIERLAELVDPKPFLGGSSIALSECGFPTTIMMGDRLLEAMGAEVPANPKIGAWMAAFDGHPVAAANTAICRDALEAWIAEKLALRGA
jgi:glutathione S-transferase